MIQPRSQGSLLPALRSERGGFEGTLVTRLKMIFLAIISDLKITRFRFTDTGNKILHILLAYFGRLPLTQEKKLAFR